MADQNVPRYQQINVSDFVNFFLKIESVGGLRMVVEFFFMTKSQPHRCYMVVSVLIIIILLSPFNTFTSNDGKVTTLSYSPKWSYWP